MLSSVSVPESVTALGSYAFESCAVLEDIAFVKQMESIDYGAFENCTGIKTVEFGEKLTSIEYGAFAGCTGLTKAIIPANVSSIADSAFSGCASLEIWGEAGSQAETYADAHSIPFHVIGEVDKPVFTMECSSIYFDEEALAHVSAPGATKVKLYIDGQEQSDYEVTDGAAQVEIGFGKENRTYQISFSAGYADGSWSAACGEQTLQVIYYGRLDTPVIDPVTTITSADIREGEFTWSEDEKAESYAVRFQVFNEETGKWDQHFMPGTIVETSSCPYTLPCWESDESEVHSGRCRIEVQAEPGARGYESSEYAYMEFDISIQQLATPVITAPSQILLTEMLTATWEAVENADQYSRNLRDSQNNNLDVVRSEDTFLKYKTNDESADGTYTLSVQANGVGYMASEKAQVEIQVICYGVLDAPKITAPEWVVPGDVMQLEWSAVDHAQTYVYTALSQPVVTEKNTATVKLTKGYELGTYTARVKASAVGYRGIESTVEFEVVREFDYEVVDGKAIITQHRGNIADVKVPAEIDGYEVVGIGPGAFEENKKMVSVVLPYSVTFLDDRAFKNCTALKRVTGSGVNTLGDEVFYGCTSLRSVDLGSVSSFGSNAFTGTQVEHTGPKLDIIINQQGTGGSGTGVGYYRDNPMIRSVKYAEGIIEIPAGAHYHNANLSYVFLPQSLVRIGSEAFAECGLLKSVSLYDQITEIADDAFSNSPETSFTLYVRDMDAVSYVEQYAIDHGIPYTKSLYSGGDGEVQIEAEGEGVLNRTEDSYTVKVDKPVQMCIVGMAAETASVYLDENVIYTSDFSEGSSRFEHVFTQIGDFRLYGYSYQDGRVFDTTIDKTIHVVGTTFAVDQTEAWTCEPIHFEVTTSVQSGTASFYADGELFAQAAVENGKASLDYGFRKAGDRKISVIVGNEASIEKTVTVKAIAPLARPVVTAEPVQILGAGLTLSWAAVEHAQAYVVRLYDAGGNKLLEKELADEGGDIIACTIPEDQLRGEGSYSAFVMAYGYQYDQSQSDLVNVLMMDADGVLFSIDKKQVATGEDVTFTVYASQATRAEMIIDDQYTEIHEMENGKLTLVRPFTKAGDRKVTFRVFANGEWTEPCEIQVVHVTSVGKLDSPAPVTKAYHLTGSDVEVSWARIAHADGYVLRVFDAAGGEIFKSGIKKTTVTIPSGTFVSPAVYTIDVMAYGAGYDQSEGGVATQIVSRLPGPQILTPTEGAAIEARSCTVTWTAVDGAQSYLISLARKTDKVDEAGNPVYEKVWASPDEVINVGAERSYVLDQLAYGEQYRVAVGSVLEGTGMEDAAHVGWSERTFRTAIPELSVSLSASPQPVYEKQPVTITAEINYADTEAWMQELTEDGTGEVYACKTNTVREDGSRVVTFQAQRNKQGKATYIVYVKGTGVLACAEQVSAMIEIDFLDANKPVVCGVEMKPDPCWVGTDALFQITGNEFTEFVDVYLHQGNEQILLGTTDTEYDVMFGTPQSRVFSYAYQFAAAGEYTLHFTPHNSLNPAEDEYGDPFEQTFTVLPKGKLPSPTLTNLKDGDILVDEENTVAWEGVSGMSFHGYSVALYEMNPSGQWVLLRYDDQLPVSASSWALPVLTAGKTYRLEVCAMATSDKDDPNNGVTAVAFEYRTVPAFSVTAIETEGLPGSSVTVKWNAPVWERRPDMKPSRYVVWWYGPGLENGKAVEMDGSQTSAVLDGTFTRIGGQYTVNVYAILSMEDGEYAQTMANGSNTFAIATPEITNIWWGKDGVVNAYRYHRMLEGQTITRQTYRIETTATVDSVEVELDGQPQGTHRVMEQDGRYYAQVELHMGEGVHRICARLSDDSTVKETHLAVITYKKETQMYAGANAGYALWPGWKTKSLAVGDAVEVRGICGGYYYVDFQGTKCFVLKDQLMTESKKQQGQWLFTATDTGYLQVQSTSKDGLSEAYMLVIRTAGKEDSAKCYSQQQMLIKNTDYGLYYRRFRMDADLNLKKGYTYQAAVVPYQKDFDAASQLVFPFEFTYGDQYGITAPKAGESAMLWDGHELTVTWKNERNVESYLVALMLEINGNYRLVYDKKIPGDTYGEDSKVIGILISEDQIRSSGISEEMKGDAIPARIVVKVTYKNDGQ